jgi:hypothetical protein
VSMANSGKRIANSTADAPSSRCRQFARKRM